MGLVELISGRSGGDVNHLANFLLKLIKFQRPVIQGRGQAEPVLHQDRLPTPIPGIHSPDLRDSGMALIQNGQKLLGEEIQQRVRPLPGSPPR